MHREEEEEDSREDFMRVPQTVGAHQAEREEIFWAR